MENNGSAKFYAIIALLLGLFAGYYFGSSHGYEKARSEIKIRLEEKRIVEPVAKEVRVMSGKIRSIGNNQFVLESQLPFDPTLPEGGQIKTVTKTVLITTNTEISIRTVEANNSVPKKGEPFRPFIVKNAKIEFKALEVSDAVVVEAHENIADKTSFEAVSVFKNGQ